MDPKPLSIGSLFSSGNVQYWIPRYQRTYKWSTDKLHGLWRDVGLLFNEEETKDHFLGIILGHSVTLNEGNMKNRIEVIDGQQRMTTLMLLLAAVYYFKEETYPSKSGKRPKKITPPGFYYLNDEQNKKTERKVLELLSTDNNDFDSVMTGKWLREYTRHEVSPIVTTFCYFRYCLWAGKDSFDRTDEYVLPSAKKNKVEQKLTAPELWAHRMQKNGGKETKPFTEKDIKKLEGIIRHKLCLLRILTEKEDEDPVLIFDSINGKRMEFTQWDHVRAYFAKHLGRDDSRFDQWDKAQEQLSSAREHAGKRRGGSSINDEFLYNFLIMLGTEHKVKPNKNRTYLQLVQLLKGQNGGADPSKRFLEEFSENELLPAARVYSYLVAPGFINLKNTNNSTVPPKAIAHISQINAFSKGPAEPLILNALIAWESGKIDDAGLLASLKSVEAFLARKVLSGDELSPLRSEFMNILGGIRKSDKSMSSFTDNLQKELRKSMPSDSDIMKAFAEPRDFYTKSDQDRVAAILRGIEQGMSGEAAHPTPFGNGMNEFNVDHILPQQCRKVLNEKWIESFKKWGTTESEIDEAVRRIDCLGNLALHASYSNKSDQAASFEAKKKAFAGTSGKKSVVLKHTDFARNADRWTAKEIDQRTKALLTEALKYWKI
jgi:uncharacterized protein with ParB-like and HNH nuclease domain